MPNKIEVLLHGIDIIYYAKKAIFIFEEFTSLNICLDKVYIQVKYVPKYNMWLEIEYKFRFILDSGKN